MREEPYGTDERPHDDLMWRRLSDAIASLEVVAARIASEMNELVKSRETKEK